ncbi:MAG: PRC-barrel domain-containing protein [Rhodospirillales bacterium]|nr:PRC-barrel domain-containing protein [Rhodospirillales bacterium]MCB9997266.1 PRC-barrel domain-containing protein [Rhodospirillales bacterium]
MKYIVSFFCIICIIFSAGQASAQQGAEAFAANIAALNRTPASRNPVFQDFNRVFTLRVLDTNRQWAGDVADLKIDGTGAVTQVVGNINRVSTDRGLVTKSVGDLTFMDDISSFVMSLESLPENSAEALAAITPAAGGDGKVYSFKAMNGAKVYNTQGKWVGVVKNLMLDKEMNGIEAIVLEDVPGARRYTEIAIPFDPDHVTVNAHYEEIELRLDPAAAKAVTDFAKDHR